MHLQVLQFRFGKKYVFTNIFFLNWYSINLCLTCCRFITIRRRHSHHCFDAFGALRYRARFHHSHSLVFFFSVFRSLHTNFMDECIFRFFPRWLHSNVHFEQILFYLWLDVNKNSKTKIGRTQSGNSHNFNGFCFFSFSSVNRYWTSTLSSLAAALFRAFGWLQSNCNVERYRK